MYCPYSPLSIVSYLNNISDLFTWRKQTASKTEFYYKKTPKNAKAINFLKESIEPYSPPALMFNATIKLFSNLISHFNMPQNPFTRDILTYSDGGTVALDFYPKKHSKSLEKLIILSPGVTGSSQDPFMINVAMQLYNKSGITVVVYNRRGSSGVPISGKKEL